MSTTRPTSSLAAFCALVGLLIAATGLAGAQQDPAAMPDLSAIPEACINGGTEVQTLCADTFAAAQAFFNVDPAAAQAGGAIPAITQAQIDQFVSSAPPPSPECCRAACEFNAQYCSCNQGVLAFAVQLSGNDPSTYASVATGFGRACGFEAFIGDTCPTPELQASGPKQECAATSGAASAVGAGAPAAGGGRRLLQT